MQLYVLQSFLESAAFLKRGNIYCAASLFFATRRKRKASLQRHKGEPPLLHHIPSFLMHPPPPPLLCSIYRIIPSAFCGKTDKKRLFLIRFSSAFFAAAAHARNRNIGLLLCMYRRIICRATLPVSLCRRRRRRIAGSISSSISPKKQVHSYEYGLLGF